MRSFVFFFFFQAEDGIRDVAVTGVQTCALPICNPFWISDNNSGFTTLYDQNGALNGSFTVAPPNGSSNPATPTGIVAPPSGVTFNVNGQPGIFIFDTEDGKISACTG